MNNIVMIDQGVSIMELDSRLFWEVKGAWNRGPSLESPGVVRGAGALRQGGDIYFQQLK